MFSKFDVPFPNVTLTSVSGINNRGQIVGRYIERDQSVNQVFNRGFIATPLKPMDKNLAQDESLGISKSD